ncbi:MAG TPA: acylglycerol kinase family protein [Candidatus Saccharimonadales bacterium]|nr:acylglycerol kinase family protein [Candidatus Saccharimonadales bacterium]
MSTVATPSFDHFIVFLNPAGTGAKRSWARVSELQALFPDHTVDVVYSSTDGRAANQELLVGEAARLGPKTLLCIGGGDGTVGMVVETLMTHPDLSATARQTPILPLWGGNANDLAYMLNGSPSSISLKQLFAKGEVVPIQPLECKLLYKNGTEKTRIAICYTSFGGTAYASKRIAEAEHRNHPLRKLFISRLLFEAAASVREFMRAPGFAVEEAGKQKIVYERTIVNGARFAKTGIIPIRLDQKAFFDYTLENKGLVATPIEFLESTRKASVPNFLKTTAEFNVKQTTLAQFDGETQEIPAGTEVHVTLSKQPVNVLSTQLANHNTK